MSKVKVWIDREAVKTQILLGQEIYDLIEAEAQKRCGSDQHVRIWRGYDRVNAKVYDNTGEYQS